MIRQLASTIAGTVIVWPYSVWVAKQYWNFAMRLTYLMF